MTFQQYLDVEEYVIEYFSEHGEYPAEVKCFDSEMYSFEEYKKYLKYSEMNASSPNAHRGN